MTEQIRNSKSDSDSGTDSIRDSDIRQISMHNAGAARPAIFDDKTKDSIKQKGSHKRICTFVDPSAKRPRRIVVGLEVFRTSESFSGSELDRWLKSNQHLRSIKGGAPKICELLDEVRRENPALNEIFLDFVEKGKIVNPYFFDIAQLVLPKDSLILPPEWKHRTDQGATYVWSFDIPIKDLEPLCEEIEKDIINYPHDDPNTTDYRSRIIVQFRDYLENELPKHEKVDVFHWLYVGQTIRNPARRWSEYYKRESPTQRTLSFATCTLTERKVPHRLVVISSDGTKEMESVVAGLLNICVDSYRTKLNAINRVACGGALNQYVTERVDRQTLALQEYNCEVEMIICVHCRKEVSIDSRHRGLLRTHTCSTSTLMRKVGRGKAPGYCRLYAQTKWCPDKDTCQACIVIVPRPKNDTWEYIPVEETLEKGADWKVKNQLSVLNTLDHVKNKIVCMHCDKEVARHKNNKGRSIFLRHGCSGITQRRNNGELAQVKSNLFFVHDWCPDKVNCKSCIQVVKTRDDVSIDVNQLSPRTRQRVLLPKFDFDRQRIICVHCHKEQKRAVTAPTQLNPHTCVTRKGKGIRGKLFCKMDWCPDEECTQCLRIEDRVSSDTTNCA